MEFENRWNTLSAASTGEMPMAREMSPMEQEMRSWDSSLDALGKVIEILEQRLMLILTDAGPRENRTATDRIAPPTIPLAAEFRQRRNAVEMMTDRLASIQARIGL